MMEVFGIKYDDLMRKTVIKPGDKIRLTLRSDNGRSMGQITTKVLEVYRHHVLLDFGKYKECRRIADIALGLVEV